MEVAQLRAAADAMCKVRGKLFHLADGMSFSRRVDQHGVIRPHHLVAVALGGLVIAPVARYCAIWRKIQGFEEAARPIITASQPVRFTMRTASSGVTISPLPITGIFTAALTSAMRDQSALPQ